MSEGSERREFSEKRRKGRVEAWKTIIGDEGGLADIQRKVLEKIKAEIGDQKSVEEAFSHFLDDTFIVTGGIANLQYPFSAAGLSTKICRNFHRVEFKRSSAEVDGMRPWLSAVSLSPDLSKQQKVLFYIAALFKAMNNVHSRRSTAEWRQMERTSEQQESLKKAYSETDLTDPTYIIADNAQTLFDVVNTLTVDCESLDEQKKVIERLLTERNEYMYQTPDGKEHDLNPYRRTNLELCAMAPFRFWAATHKEFPVSANSGELFVDAHGERAKLFSDEFVYLLTHYNFEDDDGFDIIRHGGCPAMHPEPREKHDLVNELGKTFLAMYDALYKSSALNKVL